MRKSSLYIILAAILFCGGFVLGSGCHFGRPTEPTEIKVDTLIVHDTITFTEAISITKRVVDSVFVPVWDTLTLHDTLFVLMERDQVRWEDSLSVVYASGINPQVDSVRHFIQDKIITKEIPVIQVKKTRWGVGISGGYGVGKEGLTPWVGVGVSYNLLSW